MPSAEGTTTTATYPFKVMPETTEELISRDVDLLVSQIKENLRLSGFKAKSSVSHKNRPSPYHVPSRSWAEPGNCDICANKSNNGTTNEQQRHHHHYHHHHHHLQNDKNSASKRVDDPYELLKELLREGGLIKEAVKRLRTNLDDDFDNYEDDIDDEDDDDDDEIDDNTEESQSRRQIRHRDSTPGYRRKPYFYDSEDEPLPPVYEPLQL